MDTIIRKITDNEDNNETIIKTAADIIARGGLVAFPTETVYGLGANALDKSASTRIYEAKGRPSNNPLIVHIAKPEDAEKYVYTDERYYKIAKAFMPGPITVILPTKNVVAESVCAGLDTLAVRCPSHPIARSFIEACGCPIAAPSANTSGRPSPTSASHVLHDLDGKIDLIIDGGECEVGLESTIIKLDKNGKCILLRPGGITPEMLTDILGNVEIAHGVVERPHEDEKVESPGMLISHYAPKAPLYLVRGSEIRVNDFLSKKLSHDGAYVLCCDGVLENSDKIISLGSTSDLSEIAKRLFAALREADELGAREIFCPYPSDQGLGLALLNRMLRASAFRVIDADDI